MMKKTDSRNRLLIGRYFLIIFMIVATVVSGGVAGFYYFEKRNYLSRLKLEERVNLKLQMELIDSSLVEIVSDLKFLSKQNELLHMFEQDGAGVGYKNQVAKEYLEFSHQKQRYDQIRFIDNTGMEKVRVNFNNGTPVIVPENGLQPKGNRYYFKDTIALRRDEIFVSPFDLNIEKGKIETPFKPMIRFGTSVFDRENRKRGVIVLNYLGDKLLRVMKESSKISPGNVILVNSDGYWISSPNASDEWGFMIQERKDRKFSSDFPDVWKKIGLSQETQIESKKGLFTSATVYPVTKGSITSSGSSDPDGSSEKSLMSNEYFWKVISYVSRENLLANTKSLRTLLLFLLLSLLLLAAVCSWLIAQGIVRRKLYQKELYRSANFDKLTNVPNRALFLDRLNQNLKQSKRYGSKFALFFIDLDGFKSVNDTLGHKAGDELLAETAKRIQNCVREVDTVARMGGDEFTVIVSSITSVDDAQTVALKILAALSTPFKIKDQEAQIGASIGISAYPDNGMDAETLLKNADDAMYLAKNSGKNDYRLSPS